MTLTASLFGFFLRRDEDERRALVLQTRDAARAFIASPAYAVLLSEAGVGQMPPEGEEQAYLALQRLVYRINEMAELDVAAVMRQKVALANDQLTGLDRA